MRRLPVQLLNTRPFIRVWSLVTFALFLPMAMLTPVPAGEIEKRVDPGSKTWFEDRTKQAGVAEPHTNRTFKNPYADIMKGYTALGASVAASDYNRDGYEDLFVTDSQEDGLNHLYRNNGDFTFSDVAQEAGVDQGNDANNASANALWFDYNNNGYPDLLVIRFGHNLLFENQCDGTFLDVTARAGIGTRYLNCIAAIAFDYDLDGDLDLFLGNYFQPVDIFDPETPRFFPENFETANNGGGVNVYRNNGDGTFSDVTEAAGFDLSGWTLDLGHADMDHDGDDDLFVAADFGTDRLFINNGDGSFSDITEQAIGFDTKKGMNVDWGDFDNDGLFDVYVTNITDDYMREGNFLWRNNGDATFSDVARETGTYRTGWGWAGKFFDYDNDGWLDLYVVNGWVSAGEENYIVDIFKLIIQPDLDMSDARIWPPMGNKTLSGYQKNV
ncbi:MAG: VCBS repeat-containing protein, partial [Candidatus Latescibacteria bacterium]|nr:VCBS repeat-containing protein [Candidatus Latescibacterota bacterium]